MSKVRRTFSETEAALLRRGRLLNALSAVSGKTENGSPSMTGTLVGRPSFWVKPGVPVVFVWRVAPHQANSAWLEADAIITAVVDGKVTVEGASPCRPSRNPRTL